MNTTEYLKLQKEKYEYRQMIKGDGVMNLIELDKEILKKLRQGLYPSEIVLSKVVKLLQDGRWKHITAIKDFNNLLLRQIDDWEREIANTELTNRGEEID